MLTCGPYRGLKAGLGPRRRRSGASLNKNTYTRSARAVIGRSEGGGARGAAGGGPRPRARPPPARPHSRPDRRREHVQRSRRTLLAARQRRARSHRRRHRSLSSPAVQLCRRRAPPPVPARRGALLRALRAAAGPLHVAAPAPCPAARGTQAPAQLHWTDSYGDT